MPDEYSTLWRCPELRWPRARVDQLRSGVDELGSHRFGACPRPERAGCRSLKSATSDREVSARRRCRPLPRPPVRRESRTGEQARLSIPRANWRGRARPADRDRATTRVHSSPRCLTWPTCLTRRNSLPPGTSQDPGEITLASNVMDAGGTIDEVQQLLGHASISSSQVYLHPAPQRLRDAVERVGQSHQVAR